MAEKENTETNKVPPPPPPSNHHEQEWGYVQDSAPPIMDRYQQPLNENNNHKQN